MHQAFNDLTPRPLAQKLQLKLEEAASFASGKQAEYWAALVELEAHVINTACDNPGNAVTYGLILPLVQSRLLEKTTLVQDIRAAQVSCV